jgi:UDP-N-acetylbacillosamine N-acetyltransferase
MNWRGLIVLGFGGHARSVAAVALANGVGALVFVDDNAKSGEAFEGFPATSNFDGVFPSEWACMPAAGDNCLRREQIARARHLGWPLAKVIAKDATVDVGAKIGPGSFVGHHAHIGPSADIGEGCIVNTGAIVEHESLVGDFSHVSVNAVVAGRSRLGRLVFLGASATVIDGVSVADDVVIGAGAVVVDSISSPGIYVGCPAKQI